MKVIDRKIIEATAKIIGMNSAAAKVLDDAKNYDEPVFIKHGHTLFVTEKNTLDHLKDLWYGDFEG